MWTLDWWFALLVAPIALRALIYVVALVVEPWPANPDRFIPSWAQVLVAVLFGLLAGLLLISGRHDRRAWALGLLLLDVGATLLDPFVRAIEVPPAPVTFAVALRTDAFQAALVWFFASAFPAPARRKGLAWVFVAGTLTALALGIALAGLDVMARWGSSTALGLLDLAPSLARRSPDSADLYFSLQLLVAAPVVLLVPIKLRESGPDDRRRFKWLVLGLGVGFSPLALQTLAVTVWPGALDSLERVTQRLAGFTILLALLAVPIAATYAALVQQTLDVRLVIRVALQYVFARSLIWTLSAMPFAALLLVIAWNRERAVIDLLSGGLGLTLLGLSAAGVVAALGRRRLRATLDRRFFRQEADAREMLLAVADAARQAASLDELRDCLVAALDEAIHPCTVVTAIAGSDDRLHALDADLPPLSRGSALGQLLTGSDAPLDLAERQSGLVSRLGSADREWCRAARAVSLLPLRGADRTLLGVVALGDKRSELPYTSEDRRLLAAAGSAAGLALDRLLRSPGETSAGVQAPSADPPARECVDCGTVLEANARVCDCGGLLQRAWAPWTLSDRLRFIQRIGTGGMGVVYRALDLRLNQVRAVKTLSGTDPEMIARLRREARAMAAVQHQNLAMLHGFELWRGAPMLVMEFLEGRTMADRLRRRPLPLGEVVAIGMHLAGALEALHAAGMLHRDIKPSNIGFTADGVPKLLDFGLAKLVPPSELGSTAAALPQSGTTWSEATSGGLGGIRGTPAYLSPNLLSGEPPCAQHDLWSLAVTLLEACTGHNPFLADTVASTVARVLTDTECVEGATRALPPGARRLFNELLGPAQGRPTTAYEFARRLRQSTTHGG